MADLRTKTMAVLRPDAQMRMDNADAGYAADQALQASASSELSKGWTSAGLSERVNQLMWDASTAYKAGDVQTAKALEDEGRRTAQVAASWSPEVKNWSDVHDLSSGAKWAMGALGNVRSSVMPAIGGLVGAAGGGLLTRSAEGARWGAALGAGLTGYDQMTNETAGEAMLDPSIRANKTIDQIRDTARVSGAIQAPLEALVPATMGGALLGLGKGAGKQAIKAAVAKEVGREAAGEFGTEFAQDLVGQGAINTLKDRPVTELDYKRALDSAMAGAVAGGGMGLVGGAGHVVHAGLDKTVDTAKDPSNVIEYGSAVMGKLKAKAENKLDGYVNFIAGQECGTKTEHLQYAAGGKYPPEKILMLGDAPGDQKAAQANGVLFFPIIPGHEEDSWARLGQEGLDRFFAGTFAGEYQKSLLEEFDKALPSTPPWQKKV